MTGLERIGDINPVQHKSAGVNINRLPIDPIAAHSVNPVELQPNPAARSHLRLRKNLPVDRRHTPVSVPSAASGDLPLNDIVVRHVQRSPAAVVIIRADGVRGREDDLVQIHEIHRSNCPPIIKTLDQYSNRVCPLVFPDLAEVDCEIFLRSLPPRQLDSVHIDMRDTVDAGKFQSRPGGGPPRQLGTEPSRHEIILAVHIAHSQPALQYRLLFLAFAGVELGSLRPFGA